MHRTFIAGVFPPPSVGVAWWFAFLGQQVLVHTDENAEPMPQLVDLAAIGLTPSRIQFLGTLDGQPCFSAELPGGAIAPAGMSFIGLRDLYSKFGEAWFMLSGRAIQIMEWDRTHQYCGHCATPMTQLPHERAKRCPSCGLVNYPRLAPAIIVLVSRGQEILLARAPRFPPGMYSILAGFVEPGESLEETVKREVLEEVGIEVKDIHYFASQPWPFPHSLMIGFTATYASGEIEIEPEELSDAAWFHWDNLPPIPPPMSIARRLIDWFVQTNS